MLETKYGLLTTEIFTYLTVLTEMDEPHTLVVLAEEELVLIDLETQGWPSFALPYLNSLHCSPITCSQHVSNVPDNLWQKIADAGQAQNKNLSSRVRLGCSSRMFSCRKEVEEIIIIDILSTVTINHLNLCVCIFWNITVDLSLFRNGLLMVGK